MLLFCIIQIENIAFLLQYALGEESRMKTSLKYQKCLPYFLTFKSVSGRLGRFYKSVLNVGYNNIHIQFYMVLEKDIFPYQSNLFVYYDDQVLLVVLFHFLYFLMLLLLLIHLYLNRLMLIILLRQELMAESHQFLTMVAISITYMSIAKTCKFSLQFFFYLFAWKNLQEL